MLIYIGADHRGFNLKENIKLWLKNNGYEVYDVGAIAFDPYDDYPDFAKDLALNVEKDLEKAKGILICGSGIGVCIVANKFKGIRAGIGISPDQVFEAKNHDDINVLCLASDFIDENLAKKMIEVFLKTPFDSEKKYLRRIEKIKDLEEKICK
jgi:ribose 5-phosphate isomerase B